MQMGRLSSSSISSYKPTRIITTNLNHNHNRSSNISSIQCKKHPKHRQSPGVCSLCLSERLTKVSNNTTTSSSSSRTRATYYCSSSSLSSSEDESYASSASSSPPQHPNHHRRIASDVMLRIDASSAGRGFGKSRSMAAAQQQKDGGRLRSDNDGIKNSKKVISGFWAKILRPKRNKKSREINVNVNVNGVDRKVLIKNVTQSQPLGASTSSSTAVY